MMQSCAVSEWINGNWHSCLFDPVTSLVGEPTFGLLVGAGLWTAFYLAGNGSMTTPTVVTILLATVMFPVLPSAFSGIAWTILVVGATAALVQLGQKYVLSPATQ